MEEQREKKGFEENPPSREYSHAPTNVPTDEELNGSQRRLVKTKVQFELPAGKEALPLKNDNHVYCLLHLAHVEHKPISIYPGFRILGCFPSEAALRLHIERNYLGIQDCSSWATLSHQLMPICQSMEKQTNKVYSDVQVKKLVDIYSKSTVEGEEDFKQNVEEGKTGESGKSLFALEKKSNGIRAEDKPTTEMKELPITSYLSQSAKIMGQNFAVVVILRDLRESVLNRILVPEPVIAILDVFNILEDAIFYAKFTASKAYPLCSIDVVDMYEWMFPEHVDTDAVPEVYANDQLNDILSGRKDSTANAKKYERWCEETKNTPDVTVAGAPVEESLETQFAKFGSLETSA